jgi:hypothetical protein
MCVYLSEIEDVVSENVNAGKMFTAWDVTVEVRKRSKDRVQHYEVKKEVHKMWDNGSIHGYNRVLANLPNVNPQPFLYYPPSADPSTYDGKPVAPAAKVALPPPSSMSTIDPLDDDDDSDIAADGSVVYKFDTTDRLCVPNKLIRELNLKAGDEVEVVVCNSTPNGEVCIVPKNVGYPGVPPHVSAVVANLTVDRYDNVRIGRTTLTKVGVNGVAFEIDRVLAHNAIKVKKYA